MPGQRRQQRTYDHRLRDLVRETGDLTVATRLGVPRSIAAGWLRVEKVDVVTLDVIDKTESQLQAEVLKLRRRVRVSLSKTRPRRNPSRFPAGAVRSAAMLNVLRGLVGATRSFFRTQRALAPEHLALRHQVGVLKRSLGKRRLKLGTPDRGLWARLFRRFPGRIFHTEISNPHALILPKQ